MFLQFSPPPVQAKKVRKNDPEPEVSILTLAPFTPTPKISFENVKVGRSAVEKLIIRNPNVCSVEVFTKIIVDEEINLEISWSRGHIPANGENTLELRWTPTETGAWRYILKISAGRIWKDVPVALRSIASPKVSQRRCLQKNKGFPRFIVKKTSPVRKMLSKMKSPAKRPALPNITNIPFVQVSSPNKLLKGKENFHPEFSSTQVGRNRRDTYIVADPVFDDSLEKEKGKSPNLTFENKLSSNSFLLSSTVTPTNCFNPEHCSTDERSVTCRGSVTPQKKCLFPDTPTDTNETYTKHDLSSATYVKDSSSATYVKDSSFKTYPLDQLECSIEVNSPTSSQKQRHDSLLGYSVKKTLEANLWSNSKLKSERASVKPLLAITEESGNSARLNKLEPVKRKSDLTFTVPSKRPNLGTPRLTDWTKDKTASIIDSVTGLWLQKKEECFKKWLNAILAPPTDLLCEEHGHPVDVAKLWKEVQKKSTVEVASAVVTSSRYNFLRKSALVMYRCEQVQGVLQSVWAAVETGRLSVRTDRDIHLDLALQSDIMRVLLSYNPLWLRLGLEAVYNTVIPLRSNSDIRGLTAFLWARFIRDPLLLKKYKSIHSPQYTAAIKKFILKKFLALIFFLDYAKTKKLIPHDPCLFCKNAPIKESREALLHFSRETLSSMGDITKYLKHFKYVVDHKQTYLNEFDYTVNCLGVDLRDGVRLTRVVEKILLQSDLSKNLRVPAISRLQKVHNMKIVFEALEKTDFEVMYDIGPKDLVDGHKEKTLFFLWQLIHKFYTPLMSQSVTLITKWWRSDAIIGKREELRKVRRKKEVSACKIQRWYRKIIEERRQKAFAHVIVKIQSYVKMFLARKKFLKLKYCVRLVEEIYIAKKLMLDAKEKFESLKYAALVIQKRYRANKLRDMERANYKKVKVATIFIQRRFRAYLVWKSFIELKNAAICVQRRWRAQSEMRRERERFEVLKATTIMIQRRFRANLRMEKDFYYYTELKRAVITIQRQWRGTLSMREHFERYQFLKHAVLVVQRRFRAKLEFANFQRLKKTAIFVQRKWRAKMAMRTQLENYQRLRNASLVIQRRFRGTLLTRLEYAHFQIMKKTTIYIQSKWRAKLEMKRFQVLKNATVTLQRRFRAKMAARSDFDNFQRLKKASIVIQRRWRAIVAMRGQRKSFQELKSASVILQRRFRARRIGKWECDRFQRLKNATLLVQRRFRAKIATRLDFANFQRLKKSTILIQRRWRAMLAMRGQRKSFQELKIASVIFQRRFRARRIAQLEFDRFQRLKNATLFVQRRFRAKMATRLDFDNFQKLKRATVVIQRRWRATVVMRRQRKSFQELKAASVILQRRFRANRTSVLEFDRFQNLKNAVLFVQRRFRAKIVARLHFGNFERLKKATIVIQRKWRAMLAMRGQRKSFQELKSASVILQRRFRARKIARLEFDCFQSLKNAALLIQKKWRAKMATREAVASYQSLRNAAVVIQRRFRQIRVAKLEFENFQKLKKVTVFIQRKWRARIAMRVELRKFRALQKSTLFIQRRWRGKIAMRIEMEKFQTLKKGVVVIQRRWRDILAARKELQQQRESDVVTGIQKYARGYLLRRKMAHFFTLEARAERQTLRVKCKAATKIQAAWRAYKVRSEQSLKLRKICEQLVRANKKAAPENTLASRCKSAVAQLSKGTCSLQEILIVLTDLEFITRRCQKSLRKLGPILPEHLYKTIMSTNRSTPEIKVCTIAASCLINFYRFEPTRLYTWIPSYVEPLLTVMLRFCDKDVSLFPTICTLMWFFAQDKEYKNVIRATPKYKEKMSQMKGSFDRKVRMMNRLKHVNYETFFISAENLPLPSPVPDWGLEYKHKPKVFLSSVQGFMSLWNVLEC